MTNLNWYEAPIHKTTVEASDLGLRPGVWPDTITVKDEKGQEVVLTRGGQINEKVQNLGWFYHGNRHTVLVFND